MFNKVESLKHDVSGLGIACSALMSLAGVGQDSNLHSKGTQRSAGRNTKMKKLMIAASAALCAAVGFSIESQNVVGYATNDAKADIHKTWGTCFLSLDASTPGNIRLGDLSLVGSTWGTDWINFIDPTTSIIDPTKDVTYYSVAEAISDGGSAEDAEWEDFNENSKDDVEYPFGTGFLCNFVNPGIKITYAGQVNQDAALNTIDTTGKPYSFINNIYPADLTFGQIKLVGSVWGTDWVNFVDPATSIVDPSKDITYYSEAEAIADGGSAEDAEWEDYNENSMDAVPLKMGEGFLCNFVNNVKIVFPTFGK